MMFRTVVKSITSQNLGIFNRQSNNIDERKRIRNERTHKSNCDRGL